MANPGDYLTTRNRLAQMLTSGPNVNNGSIYGGLAHILQQGSAGYLQGADARDRQAAQSAMMKALLAGPTVQPQDMGTYSAPRTVSPYENAATALAGLGDNEYAAQMAVPLALQGYEAKAKAGDAERARAVALEDYAAKKQIDQRYSGADAKFGNNPLWGTDAQGNPVIMQLSSQGGVQLVQMPAGVTPMRGGTSKVDLGDKFGVLDANGGLIGYIPKGIAPEQMPDFKAAQTTAQETAKNAVDIVKGQPKREMALAGQETKINLLNGLIDDAKKASSGWTTGLVGNALAAIPGTYAHDQRKRLDTIKANIGFDRLQEMRDNSPTGGALGQVSEMENRLLQSVWGNLEQSQSQAQFEKNLDLVRDQVKASWERVNAAYEQDYGKPYKNKTTTSSPPPGAVRRVK